MKLLDELKLAERASDAIYEEHKSMSPNSLVVYLLLRGQVHRMRSLIENFNRGYLQELESKMEELRNDPRRHS